MSLIQTLYLKWNDKNTNREFKSPSHEAKTTQLNTTVRLKFEGLSSWSHKLQSYFYASILDEACICTPDDSEIDTAYVGANMGDHSAMQSYTRPPFVRVMWHIHCAVCSKRSRVAYTCSDINCPRTRRKDDISVVFERRRPKETLNCFFFLVSVKGSKVL